MNGEESQPKTQAEIHAQRMANIQPHQYQKGECGNPKGRPKGRTVAAEIRKLIADQEERGLDPIAGLAQLAMKKALSGDYRYFDYVREVIDGARKNGAGGVGTSIQINIGVLQAPEGFDPPKSPIHVRNEAEDNDVDSVPKMQ